MAESTTVRSGPLRLSAVVAGYKDALAIPLMHARLSDVFTSLAVDYEIIFVNDGSPDNTDSVLDLLAIAIFGEYVIKIFEEAKRRPKFIRKAIRQGGNHLKTAAEIGTFLRKRSCQTVAPQSLGTGSFGNDER